MVVLFFGGSTINPITAPYGYYFSRIYSNSNIGAGGDDKFTKLKELKEMLSEGLIDGAEFKQMKQEILGKKVKKIIKKTKKEIRGK